jgi:hypothetical protein
MMRRMRDVALIGALVVSAASLASGADRPPRRDPALVSLVADAAAVPSEFSADALIRIAGSSRVTDRGWKRQLLDEAFIAAYGAVTPYRRTSPPSSVPRDSRQGAQMQAEDAPITRVSLQTRAAQLMATIAPDRARELFEWIDLGLAPARCDDVLVPVVDEYYTTVSLLARTTFRPGERGEALRFLEYYLWRAHLPTELPAVALAVERFRPNASEATYFEGLLNSLMDAGTSDPRSFSVADIDIVGRFADLQFHDHERQVPGWYLMEALRKYLTKHLAGPRCSDSVSESLTPSTFNMALRLLHADEDVKPIEPQIRPSRLLGGARIDLYWQTGEARQLFETWTQLRGPDRNPVPERKRRTDEWRDAAERFVTSLDQWTGRSEASDRDYFYEKATLYANILELMPPSAVRSRTLTSFMHFMRLENTDRSRRPLWFVFVTRLLDLAHGDARREVLEAMESSGDAVLSVYGRLERMLPQGQRKSNRASDAADAFAIADALHEPRQQAHARPRS